MSVVVGISGRRGSGKSTLARELQDRHGFRVAAFGSIVRAEAASRGLPLDRPTLQQLGSTLIEETGWDEFCLSVLREVLPAPLSAVEGIRHVAAVETLTRLVLPGRFVLVFVDTPEDVRRSRLSSRGLPGDQDFHLDADATESELEKVRSLANMTMSGLDPVGAAAEISDACRSWA